MLSRSPLMHLWNVDRFDPYSVRQLRDIFRSNIKEIFTDIPGDQVSNDTLWLLDRIVDFMDTDLDVMSKAINYLQGDFDIVSKKQSNDARHDADPMRQIMYKEDIVPSDIFSLNVTTLGWFIDSNPWCVKIVVSECVLLFDQYVSDDNELFDKPNFVRQFTRGYKKLYEELKELGDLYEHLFEVSNVIENANNYVALDLDIQDDDPNEPVLSFELIEILILQMPFEEIHSIYPLSSQYRQVLNKPDVLLALEQKWELRDVDDYEDLYDQYVMKYPVDFIIENYNGDDIYYLSKSRYIYHAVRRNSPEYLNTIIKTDEDLRFAIRASIDYGRDVMLSKYIGMIMVLFDPDGKIKDWLDDLYDNGEQNIQTILLVNGFQPEHFDITEENQHNIETVIVSKLQDKANELYHKLEINDVQGTAFMSTLITSLRSMANVLEERLGQ